MKNWSAGGQSPPPRVERDQASKARSSARGRGTPDHRSRAITRKMVESEGNSRSVESEVNTLIEPSLCRLTKGLPNHELNVIVKEAEECEEALRKEIRMLEKAAGVAESTDGGDDANADDSSLKPKNPSLAIGNWKYDAMEGRNHHPTVIEPTLHRRWS